LLNVLDLFSGICGFSLGLERTGGFRTVAFCECEPYAQRVLRKHWPDVPIYDDVRTVTAARLAADGIHNPDGAVAHAERPERREKRQARRTARGDLLPQWEEGAVRAGSGSQIDCITAGFPCQDISYAGKGAGIDGERSGLWREVARLAGEIRPQYLILENVPALLTRGLGRVLGDLAAIGYDAEWHCIPASCIGAPHRRDRWWCVAYPDGGGQQELGERLEWIIEAWSAAGTVDRSGDGSDPGWWRTEPDVGRVAHGIPAQVDRLRCLGNAVVPQIPEMIGRAILGAMP